MVAHTESRHPGNTVTWARLQVKPGKSARVEVPNDGPEGKPSHPAALAGVTAVTAVDATEHLYPQATRGSYVNLAAPGVDILSTGPGNRTKFSRARRQPLLLHRRPWHCYCISDHRLHRKIYKNCYRKRQETRDHFTRSRVTLWSAGCMPGHGNAGQQTANLQISDSCIFIYGPVSNTAGRSRAHGEYLIYRDLVRADPLALHQVV